jgi:hypothetical protein
LSFKFVLLNRKQLLHRHHAGIAKERCGIIALIFTVFKTISALNNTIDHVFIAYSAILKIAIFTALFVSLDLSANR